MRKQVSFWKQLFNTINKITEYEVKTQKLQQFEPVFIKLLEMILYITKADNDTFEEFNYKKVAHEDFDDFYKVRKDYGKLIQTICKCCGPTIIYKYFIGELEKAYKSAVADQGVDNIEKWSRVECVLFCISELTHTLKSEEISLLKDSIELIYQLPNTFLAIRIQATHFI